MKNALVKDIMSKKLLTLHPKNKLFRAKQLFHQYDIHHIPVAVGQQVVGILSHGDILYLEGLRMNSFDKFLQEKQYEMTDVDEVMTNNPIKIQLDETVNNAVEVMVARRINALPVVDGDELVGLITTHDILKHFIEITEDVETNS